MKIGIDARLINATGIGVYTQNLIKAHLYDVVLGDENDLLSYRKYCEDIVPYDYPVFGMKEQCNVRKIKYKNKKLDILHVPHYNIPLFYQGRMIVSIHDLTLLVYKELHIKKFYYYAKFMIGIALKRADIILTESEYTKKDILKYYPKTNPNKIIVTYNGVDDKFKIQPKGHIQYLYDKYCIPKLKKTFLYVGNLLPHKNIAIVLEAFAKLKNKEDYRLILVGKASIEAELLAKEKILAIDEFVIHTGKVEDEELVDIYNLADVFVFPSLYEGFGLPPLEALKCGTPVLCSNSSCLPEIYANEVTYFNPHDVDDLAKKMEKDIALGNFDNLRKYDWKTTAAIIKETLQTLEK